MTDKNGAAERLRTALANLVAMVEENGPDYSDADAMREARYALGVGIHEVLELSEQGYRFDEALAAERRATVERIREAANRCMEDGDFALALLDFDRILREEAAR